MVRGEKESTVPLPHAVNCPSPYQVFQLTMALTLKRYERRSLPQALKLFLSHARTYIVNGSCIKIMQNSVIFPHQETFCHGSKRRWRHSPGPSQRACHLRPPTPTPGPAGAMLNCGEKKVVPRPSCALRPVGQTRIPLARNSHIRIDPSASCRAAA